MVGKVCLEASLVCHSQQASSFCWWVLLCSCLTNFSGRQLVNGSATKTAEPLLTELPACEQYRQQTPLVYITSHGCFEDHLRSAKLRHDTVSPLLSCGYFGVPLACSVSKSQPFPPQDARRRARVGIPARWRLAQSGVQKTALADLPVSFVSSPSAA